jgi:hypothetical protein
VVDTRERGLAADDQRQRQTPRWAREDGCSRARPRATNGGMVCLVARIWKTGLDVTRTSDYEDFARTHSLPMFQRHDGFRGVIFAAADADRVVITLWRDRRAAAALEMSSDYQATVAAILDAGFLRPPQSVELLDVQSAIFVGVAGAIG